MQAQIDSALASLIRVRERLSGTGAMEEADQISYDLEWAASHLEDIRHNWASLKASAICRSPGHLLRAASAPEDKVLVG